MPYVKFSALLQTEYSDSSASSLPAEGDQILNAESFQKQGFSYLLPEEEITNEKFLDTIHQVYSDRENYQKQMASSQQNQAIPIIADLIDQLASV